MERFTGRRRWHCRALLTPLGLLGAGCAATVNPQLPAMPRGPASSQTEIHVVVVAGYAGTDLAGEVQHLLAPLGSVEQHPLRDGETTDGACAPGIDLVARPSVGRQGFASNAAERNTLIIFESAIIVGIPLALISAASWPWYGEYTSDGDLETLWCGGASTHNRAQATVRADGHGVIAEARLRDELQRHAPAALARALVETAVRCGRFEKGGDRCSEGQ